MGGVKVIGALAVGMAWQYTEYMSLDMC